MTEPQEAAADRRTEKITVHINGALHERAVRLREMVHQILAPIEEKVVFAESLKDLGRAGRVLILHPAPAAALAQAIGAGASAAQALEEWCARARALLVLVRGHRRRISLLEEGAFLADPPGSLAALGLPVCMDTTLAAEDLAVPTPLQLLLGEVLLRRDRAARALAGELEASAAISDPHRGAADLDAAYGEYVDAVRTAARLSGLESDHAALRRFLTEVQEEQGAIITQLLKSQEAAESRRVEKEQLERDLAESQTATEALRGDIKRLNAQIFQLGQGLESGERQIESLQAEREELKRENQAKAQALEERDSELARYYASTSYRITAFLRRLRASLSPGGSA